jgi:HEPN domain-containing protein
MAEYQFDRDEWERYLKQGNHTLKSARSDMDEGDNDWACFKAQQAVELILKGFLRALGKAATGHSTGRLLEYISEMNIAIPKEIVSCCRELDKVYIPSRYPDAYAWGAPMDYYSEDNASDSIKCAEKVLNFIQGLISA